MRRRRCWYIYVGDYYGYPYENIVGNWMLSPGISPDNCNGGSMLCMAYLPECGPNPTTISTRIRNYFPIAKINQSYFPNGAGQKPYVYTRFVY